MTDQVEKLKQLAAEVARDAAMPMPPDYRIHRIGKEIRARLKAEFPATDFFIATSDGFDTMYGEMPPMIELKWNDEPLFNALNKALDEFLEERRRDFHFELILSHGFTCRECGQTHSATIYDKPSKCTGRRDGFSR
jgi:hypothetical protein